MEIDALGLSHHRGKPGLEGMGFGIIVLLVGKYVVGFVVDGSCNDMTLTHIKPHMVCLA